MVYENWRGPTLPASRWSLAARLLFIVMDDVSKSTASLATRFTAPGFENNGQVLYRRRADITFKRRVYDQFLETLRPARHAQLKLGRSLDEQRRTLGPQVSQKTN